MHTALIEQFENYGTKINNWKKFEVKTEQQKRINLNTRKVQFCICDLDGYYFMVSH